MNLIPVIFSSPKEHKKKIPWIKGLKFFHIQRKKLNIRTNQIFTCKLQARLCSEVKNSC